MTGLHNLQVFIYLWSIYEYDFNFKALMSQNYEFKILLLRKKKIAAKIVTFEPFDFGFYIISIHRNLLNRLQRTNNLLRRQEVKKQRVF